MSASREPDENAKLPLPEELCSDILIHACRLRGVKRALRLRLVNKSFNRIGLEALFKSGLLHPDSSWYDEDHEAKHDPSFWRKFVAWNVLCSYIPGSLALERIHEVAIQILRYQTSSPTGTFTNNDIQECVDKICEVPALDPLFTFMHAVFHTQSEGTTVAMWEALEHLPLATSAYLGELGLVEQLIRNRRCSDQCEDTCHPILRAAAYAGQTHVIEYILRMESGHRSDVKAATDHRCLIVEWAGKGGRFDLVDMAFFWDSRYRRGSRAVRLERELLRVLKHVTSPEAMHRYLPTVQRINPWWDRKWLTYQVGHAAANGSLDLVKYLFKLGKPLYGSHHGEYPCLCSTPMCRAAANGHEHVVAWLLEAGGCLFGALASAAETGSLKIAEMILDDTQLYTRRESIALALCWLRDREHTEMVQLLKAQAEAYGLDLDLLGWHHTARLSCICYYSCR